MQNHKKHFIWQGCQTNGTVEAYQTEIQALFGHLLAL